MVECDPRFATVREEKTKTLMREREREREYGRARCGMSSVQPVQRDGVQYV